MFRIDQHSPIKPWVTLPRKAKSTTTFTIKKRQRRWSHLFQLEVGGGDQPSNWRVMTWFEAWNSQDVVHVFFCKCQMSLFFVSVFSIPFLLGGPCAKICKHPQNEQRRAALQSVNLDSGMSWPESVKVAKKRALNRNDLSRIRKKQSKQWINRSRLQRQQSKNLAMAFMHCKGISKAELACWIGVRAILL